MVETGTWGSLRYDLCFGGVFYALVDVDQIGLTISPERLAQIRQERRPDSTYADLDNCRFEIDMAQRLMQREHIPWLDSTARSIEEISTKIMQDVHLNKRGY